jgi:hypothetical protein
MGANRAGVVLKAMKDRRRVLLWSSAAAILAFFAASEIYKYNQSYRHANRLATGTVVEQGNPGTRGNVYEPGDEGEPSTIEFHVQGKLYYSGSRNLPAVGERVLVRYNSSNPNHNHADGDRFNSNYVFTFAILAFACGWGAYKERRPEAHR